jgi:hypothetical protein
MNSSVIDVNDIDLDSIDYKTDPLQIKDIAKMLQGDNQKLMHDADLATQDCVLRGKELNLRNVRAVSSLMLIVSVLSTGVWIFEILTLVYGDPFHDDFEKQKAAGF